MKIRRVSPLLTAALLSPFLAPRAFAQIPVPDDTPIPTATALPLPAPPTAQAYVLCDPPAVIAYGRTLVPLSFLSTGLGASAGPIEGGKWRLLFFGRSADFTPYQVGATFDGASITLPTMPQMLGGQLYVPFGYVADWLGLKWSIAPPDATKPANTTTILLQYPAAYINDVVSTVYPEKVRVVMSLSNPTRIVAAQQKLDVGFQFAGARQGAIPSVQPINDYLVPRSVLSSGDWKASFAVRLNYSAPVQWFTLGNPPRLVIDAQRLFEEKSVDKSAGGLALTKIRRGTGHGPVQMWAVKLDPRDGWRVRLAPAGYSVLQRALPSRLAARHKALLAINGGFFAYDGAAVGAVLVNGEWIRLPWKGRTAVGFRGDGTARIDNLQASAFVDFSGGLRLPIRDLNGWPDTGQVTALTQRFLRYYTLRPGEMAVVVKNGVVISKPGGGGAPVSAFGFTLVASGAARPYLEKIARGEKANLSITAPGWDGITTALGGGPRLLRDAQVEVTALREAFRSDVRDGPGPRTAFGIDAQGRYIILVADGRQKFYSDGLTLTELAFTMQKLGAIDAMNLDGGGSTVMAVRGKVVNRPSDGRERSVSNALLVMR